MAFMVLTNTGHVAIAKSIKDQQLYLAWGDIPPYMDPPTSGAATLSAVAGTLPLGSYTYKVTCTTDAGETTGSSAIAFTLSSVGSSIKLTWSAVSGAKSYKVYGRTASNDYKYLVTVTAAEWIDNGSVTVGTVSIPTVNTTSSALWTTSPPSPLLTYEGLYRELGRRKVMSVKYVKPDVNGAYVTNQGRWAESLTPTKYIYAYIAYDLTDAPNNTIYQYGIFIGTVPTAGNENKQYLIPSEVSDKGSLLSIENVSPIIRNSSTREFYEIVMTF
ncbi:structural protein [Rhizobium phage RHph_TM39]|uniref:Structural protein n=2 Tax=Cuauhnahuacvirus TaxID=3044696 RepID=A0A7S5RDS4_9CAUD|nr:virion structural protein [Rhizobium phage RHph_TM30]YP_010671486.1 virion structural protein [Rhizobium phage RHph_Y65]QIG71809.1 structural protein [Rhizobium phage RHph_TM40]QIG72169.1 structural protein [Rhizobium phage RHph_TM2_3B]QIG72532.1 structural protein [Rhizobium phage RHph_TM3_3_6]QIG77302.1 structural protein [Rhizobium phage RHph_TM39]QIG71445.1 structural protein [Rhizobium phage RHph_TM30]